MKRRSARSSVNHSESRNTIVVDYTQSLHLPATLVMDNRRSTITSKNVHTFGDASVSVSPAKLRAYYYQGDRQRGGNTVYLIRLEWGNGEGLQNKNK
jgi:hypothetical protein